jgi:hypothetical protein
MYNPREVGDGGGLWRVRIYLLLGSRRVRIAVEAWPLPQFSRWQTYTLISEMLGGTMSHLPQRSAEILEADLRKTLILGA